MAKSSFPSYFQLQNKFWRKPTIDISEVKIYLSQFMTNEKLTDLLNDTLDRLIWTPWADQNSNILFAVPPIGLLSLKCKVLSFPTTHKYSTNLFQIQPLSSVPLTPVSVSPLCFLPLFCVFLSEYTNFVSDAFCCCQRYFDSLNKILICLYT